jgi:hypothetical protein
MKPFNIINFVLILILTGACKAPLKTITADSSPLINVKDFGAKGDGITDDYTAFQKALDFLHLKKKGTLFFPKGKYLVKRRGGPFIFQIKNLYNIKFKGESQLHSTIIGANGRGDETSAIFRIRNSNNIVFENLGFEAEHPLSIDNPPTSESNRNAIDYNIATAFFFLDVCNNIVFQNTTFQYFFGPAIQLTAKGNNFKLLNSTFKNQMREVTGGGAKQPQPTGILINRNYSDIIIDSCLFQNIIDTKPLNGKKCHAVYLSDVNNATISNTKFVMSDRFSFHENKSGGLNIYYGFSHDVHVINNTFDNVTSNLHSADGLFFKNNTSVNARLSINTSNTIIESNTFELSKEGGGLGLIRTAGDAFNITIRDNEFSHTLNSSTYSYAIQLYDTSKNIKISKNSFSNFYTSILLGRLNKEVKIEACEINDNTIILKENSAQGIYISSGNDNNIHNNKVLNYTDKNLKAVNSNNSFHESPGNRIQNNIVKHKSLKEN